ncbi:MAG: efflux RND transporter permease subunit [Candidatus Zixiibacteriota bacterium]
MKRITEFMVRYPIWVTVIMFTVVVFGLISLAQMRYSFFPENPPDYIYVEVVYPGASPEEVAEGVVLKIEDNLDGIEGVERVTSTSRENSGVVRVEIVLGADIDKVLADVKNAVDRINSFPGEVENPVIYADRFRSRSLSVGLSGNTDLFSLKYMAEQLRDQLLATDEISQVNISGIPSLEFAIELSEADLRRYNLTFTEVRNAVAQANINLSGGKFDTQDEEILIRAWGRDYYAHELLDIPIRGDGKETVVYLKDIASVRETWEDQPNKVYYNGHPSILLGINQTEDEDIIAIANKTYEILDDFRAQHPGVEVTIHRDTTTPLRQRIELMVKNGLLGLVLVLICLGFFLNLRLSFWVAVSIPFSFAGMFIIASAWGITVNVLSLAAMIIVVGILVDDAIVVGENIFAHYERGKSALRAAFDGTVEVLPPVVTSVITTVIVFTSFFFLNGMMGKMMWQMGLVVVASLLFSLFEAFFILPSHLAHSKGLKKNNKHSKTRDSIEKVIQYFTHRVYGPVLKWALDNKYAVVVMPIAFILITIGLLRGGIIGVTFFPNIDGDEVPINIALVPGRQEVDTDSILARIERIVWDVNDELSAQRDDSNQVIIGVERTIGSNDFDEGGSHTGKLDIELLDGEIRQMDSYIIANRIREAVGPVPEAQNITFGAAGRFGKAVSVSLLGDDENQLTKARDLLKVEMEQMSSLKDVTDTDQKGRREIDIQLKPRAYALGLTLNDVAGQVRQGFFGQEIQRIQRGRDEIKVWVRYRPEDRAALGSLDNMRIRTSGGGSYPFSELAEYSIKRGVTQIKHLDRKREIKVEANQADVKDDLPPILEEIQLSILPKVLSQVHGVTAQFEGQSREQAKMMKSMQIAFSIALISMFVMVVLVFRSYAQALMVFSLIPIGILGAFWGHGIHNLQVSMLSMVGIIALAGIIINDSIVFVDQINRNLREEQKVRDALYNAGISRLRPILLTTLTTALGMGPLIFETSRQAQFLIPMGLSIAYGLMFGTIILLIILPASYLVINRLRQIVAKLRGMRDVTAESVEPAVQELTTAQLDFGVESPTRIGAK